MGSIHHNTHSHMRGPSRVLLLATLCFVGIAIYVLVITHHLRIDSHGLHLQRQGGVSGSSALLQLSQRPQVDPAAAAAFVTRMEELGALSRYDKDEDGKLSAMEFRAFLTDLSRSKVLDPQVLSSAHGAGADVAMGNNLLRRSAVEERESGKTARQSQQQQQSETISSANRPSTSQQSETPATKATTATTITTTTRPAAHCPELSKELVQSFAVNNTIMLTVSDWRIFETFGVNWMKHLKVYHIDYFLVGATDKQTSEFLAGQGRHPCFKFFEDGHGHAAQREYRYGDAHYNAATWRKVSVVAQIVNWGFNVLHSDVDVVWFRDPLPYFLGPAVEHADVAVSTDLISTRLPRGDEGLEVDVHLHVNVNTGVYFVKSSPGGRVFMNAWSGLRQEMQHENDQVGLYKWLRSRPGQFNKQHRYFEMKADNDPTPVRLGMLASHMLLNGYSYFIPKLHQVLNVSALGIHMTWVPLSREGKFHRMRDGMLYIDPPEYYSEPLYVAADLDFPETPTGYNDEQDTEKMIRFHLQAMDKQLVQVYRVMAVSVILNRTLVLPKMKCFCFKNWFMSEQCRIPGDRVTQFPLDCALDQWLRPKVVYQYGQNIISKDDKRSFMFREHTLLENPRFPKELLHDQVIVQPGPDNSSTTVQDVDVQTLSKPVTGVNSGKIKVITIAAGTKEAALRQELQRLAGQAKIIRLRNPHQLFGGWDDPILKQSFETFVDKVAANWCCRDEPYIKQGMNRKEKLAIHW